MKIIIVGAGQVGGTLAENLAREYADITLIDINERALRSLQDRLDIRTVVGTGCYPDVLVKAGIEDADMLVAVTSSDEVNIIACQVAYSLFHTPTKIARVRAYNYTNPKYKSVLFNDKNMPVDVMITPEQAVTDYIRKLIEQPGALQVLDFADGVIQLVGLRAVKDSPLVGQELRTLKEHMPKADARVAAIYRKDRAIFPVGDTVIEDGDEVFFIAAKKNIRKVMSELRRLEKPYHRLVIAGGGNIGFRLSKALEEHYNIKIIEFSPERTAYLSEKLNRAVVLNGSATDQELLLDENIEKTDVFLALTNDDEVNILAALLAKRMGTKRAIALINNPIYGQLLGSLGIDVHVDPRETTVSTIIQHIRRGRIKNLHAIRDGEAEIVEAEVTETSSLVGLPLRKSKLPKGIIVGAIVRDKKVLAPRGDMVIQEGDHMVVFVMQEAVKDIEHLFALRMDYY